ncbi:Actin-like protein arp9 (SWI/SNF complex component arp9) [Stylosanthes scabra]|uniref:Actin-like protein arp9 (SWI/SNF complex component arp9) n=1 Tax=Stylosanthes scabra TaxID=79078 RepID=A0ABU6UN01_9FABA|nr:Actin-like protein arp9 (SWI/SNF complex component arp9) [Stylosanthes scabra]
MDVSTHKFFQSQSVLAPLGEPVPIESSMSSFTTLDVSAQRREHQQRRVVLEAPTTPETSSKDVTSESLGPKQDTGTKELHLSERKFREFICGEEALRISRAEPYCLNRPIRRGHLNISQHYSMQQ